MPSSIEHVSAEPSIARSEWTLLAKTTLAQRTYLLTIRDRDGKIIDSLNAPEMILDGDVQLNNVSKAGLGKWKVVLDFPGEQSVVRVGFRVGEYRIDGFRRVHWQLQQIDNMSSTAFTNKIRLRSDGKDSARVFVHLRDMQNFPVYQAHDFDLRLRVLSGKTAITGPFNTVSGPYFEIRSSASGTVRLEALIDGVTFGQPMEVEFIGKTSRAPASAGAACVIELAKFVGREATPNAPLKDEYERLGHAMVESFQTLITPSEMQLEDNLRALSSPACTSVAQLDEVRESVSAELRQFALKAHRMAQGKGNIHNMWNPFRSPQR